MKSEQQSGTGSGRFLRARLLDMLGQEQPAKRTQAHGDPLAAVEDRPASPPS